MYVCNSGNTDDTQAGEGTTISVLPLTLDDETQITVPKNPKLIAAYSANKMYFNVLGDGGMHSALYKFNPTTPNVAPILVTEKAGGFAIGSQYLYTADNFLSAPKSNKFRIINSFANSQLKLFVFAIAKCGIK